MPWSTTADIEEFAATAGAFLLSHPVEHSPLLTESDHVRRHPRPEADQAYGWWTDDAGEVAGAFLRAPRHPPVLTPLPDAAVEELVAVLPVDGGVGCDVTTVDAALSAWERAGVPLAPRYRLVIHRLDAPRMPPPAKGSGRLAGRDDRALLHEWFEALMAAHPGDPSDRTYVVDDPLAEKRIVLWEIDGVTAAMAGWSRPSAGMTRVGAAYAPSGDPLVEAAVLGAASEAAAAVANDVLVLAATSDRDGIARLAALGYRAVRERVLLAPLA